MPHNIVCLSTLDVSTHHIVDQLLQAIPETKLIRLHCQPPQRTFWNKVRKFSFGRAWRRIEERLYYDRYYAQGRDQVRQLLFGDNSPPELPTVAELKTSEVNHLSTAALLRSLEPDVMITVGAPILKPHIFTIPRAGTINVHFGIAPFFRGEETVFWPLFQRREQHLGVTIHQIDRGIDTGPILAHGYVDVEARDTEWTLEAKTAQLGARMLVDLLDAGSPIPDWQPPRVSSGRQFNYKSRHIWHDAWLYARRNWLQETLREAPEFVRYYCDAAARQTALV